MRTTVMARLLRSCFDRRAVDLNVTRSQWSLLHVVTQCPGATQRVIAERLELSEASAGRLIDRLCADGLLERRPKEDDRRAHAIYLAQAAQPLIAKLADASRTVEMEVFRGFSETELEQFLDLSERMYANLSRLC